MLSVYNITTLNKAFLSLQRQDFDFKLYPKDWRSGGMNVQPLDWQSCVLFSTLQPLLSDMASLRYNVKHRLASLLLFYVLLSNYGSPSIAL